jgi:hypothetical protein
MSIRLARNPALVTPRLRDGARSLPIPDSIRVPWKRDLSRDAMLLTGLLVGIADAIGAFAKPVDAVVYWQAGTSSELYPTQWGDFHEGHLMYPPPVAQLSTLLQPIGWQLFVIILMVATFAAFWFCARKWSLPLVVIGIPYFLGIGPEAPATFLAYALLGNIQWILAALTVVALDHPAAYPALVLTKGTSGIGWLWHLVRGEWLAALVGAAATVGVLAISFVAAPSIWIDFLNFVSRNAALANPPMPTFPVPFGIRFAIAIVLLFWGAARNHRWTVPIAAGLALPVVWGLGFLPFFVAATRLVRRPQPA